VEELVSKVQKRSSSINSRGCKLRLRFSKKAKKKSKNYLKEMRRKFLYSQVRVEIDPYEVGNVELQLKETMDGTKLRNHDLKRIDLDKLHDLTDEEADDLLHTWELWARPNQLEPEDILENGEHWVTWLILAGRGFGKTRCGAETVIKWVREGKCKRIALVAEDSADARDVMVEGESGILACSPRNFKPKYEPSKRRLTWPNGAVATLFSAEDYDSLRGPQFDGAWCDELCKWRYAQEAWDNLQFGLRLGDHPKQIVTTTPRPVKLLKDIILRSDTAITKGTTMENLVNLAPPFRKAVVDKYLGTRLGRQELNAELLDDIPGALWNRKMLDTTRVNPVDSLTPLALPHFVRIIVAVDPAKELAERKMTKGEIKTKAVAETGIVVVGKDAKGHGYVLEDLSLTGSPEEWGRVVVQAFDDWGADNIVYEANQGGEMVAAVIRNAAKSLKFDGERDADFVPLKDVHATRGKYVRAEPVSQLYEQNRVHHVGTFPTLEDQMCEYTPDGNMGYSPDRMDALVWGITELLVGSISHEGLMDYYRQEAMAVADRLMGKNDALPSTTISLQGPEGINTAFGALGEKYIMQNDGLFHVKETDVKGLESAGFRRYFAPLPSPTGDQ
jgi:phage terminase large subunit-like protein